MIMVITDMDTIHIGVDTMGIAMAIIQGTKVIQEIMDMHLADLHYHTMIVAEDIQMYITIVRQIITDPI
jgi:D-ribose pyranose/furanose isomerase RbsD